MPNVRSLFGVRGPFHWLVCSSHANRRRQWHPTPVHLSGKSHGWRSLVGCSLWGRKESDTTKRLHFLFSLSCIGEGNGNPLRVLAWRIPGTGEPGELPSMGSHRVGHDWVTSLSLFTFMHWRRKWQPTPCSCLENPRDGGAWWAAVCGVARSRTQLKWCSSSSSSLC